VWVQSVLKTQAIQIDMRADSQGQDKPAQTQNAHHEGENMCRVLCLLILLLGTNCSTDGVGAPDMSMAPVDLSMPGQTKVCSADNWCWENPLPQGNVLAGVWGTGANVWAVGAGGTIL
jgi:hypothetical protein